jgi:hypothetical protein
MALLIFIMAVQMVVGVRGIMWSFPVSNIFSVTMAGLMPGVAMRKLNRLILDQKRV